MPPLPPPLLPLPPPLLPPSRCHVLMYMPAVLGSYIAGGLPIGAVLLKEHVATVMAPGDHGSTFAGNPLVCHAACTVFDIIAEPGELSSRGTRTASSSAGSSTAKQRGMQAAAGKARV